MIANGDQNDHDSELSLIGELLSANFPHLDPATLNIRRLVLVERDLVIHSRLI
jgi:hypothetical protein